MDEVLCDELLIEIFTRLPHPSSTPVTLVSRRWLSLYHSSLSSLSLRLPAAATAGFPILLSRYPSLSSLSLLLPDSGDPSTACPSGNFLSAIASHCPATLTCLRLLSGPPANPSFLLSLSRKLTRLTSLTVSLSRPLFFTWVLCFPSLRELSVSIVDGDEAPVASDEPHENSIAVLALESLSLSGVRGCDWGLCWLWQRCRNLKKLLLKSCEGIGDDASDSSFVQCLPGLEEVELRTSRSIVNGVLSKMAETCEMLSSLLVYDGGSRDGLLHFISSCRCNLQNLDFRLPLDFKNDHLFALARNSRALSSLRLQSCCLVTGDGLKAFVISMSGHLRELSLINCDVVEREPGLLATLGQHLRRLRKLDVSYNEMLPDKEIILMLASCRGLVDLRLRGCKGLGNSAIISIPKSCRILENIDIVHCCGVKAKAVELLILSSPRLRWVQVEDGKVSDVARNWAAAKFIEIVA